MRVDFSVVNAVRFMCVLGGDYPLGDESQRRKTVAVSVIEKRRVSSTVMEPFEDKRTVKSAVAPGPDMPSVELNDGRVHEIRMTGLEGNGRSIIATLTESRDGKFVRTETTAQSWVQEKDAS